MQDREEASAAARLHFINILYSDGKTVRHQQDENLNLRLLSRAAAPAADDDDDDDGARRTRLSACSPPDAAAREAAARGGAGFVLGPARLHARERRPDVAGPAPGQVRGVQQGAACDQHQAAVGAEQLESSNYNMLRADDPSPVLKRDRDDSDEERRTRSKS